MIQQGEALTTARERMTPAEFDAFARAPERTDLLYELIDGVLYDVPSNPYASKFSLRIGRYLGQFVDERDLGHVTGEAGGFMIDGERYAPDVAYISRLRQPELAREGYNPNPPELAVEVETQVSAASERRLNDKLKHYMATGTWAWVFYPEIEQVKVYIPGQPMVILGIDDVLDGGALLPGFRLALKDIFR